MRKSTKSKNGKVPKITEEEYTAYLALLREKGEGVTSTSMMEKKSK